MALENVTGNLLAYKELEPGSLQDGDKITTERRTSHKLRDRSFYTGDGELYTVQEKECLWAITREPQNLVLQNIDEAYKQLTGQGNYFPEAEAGRVSLNHEDTVVVEHKGLELEQDIAGYGHFVINPRNVNALNSQRRIAAVRLFGPDKKSFYKNMEMFAEAGKTPYVFILLPDYVQDTLRRNDEEFLMRASWLVSFNYNSNFNALGCGVNGHLALRGVRRVIVAGDIPENEVPRVPQETESVGNLPLEDILACLGDDVASSVRPAIEARITEVYRKAYKQ